jgi:hypothetical protein
VIRKLDSQSISLKSSVQCFMADNTFISVTRILLLFLLFGVVVVVVCSYNIQYHGHCVVVLRKPPAV